MVYRSVLLQGEGSIVISCIESVMSFDLLGGLVVGSLIVDGMSSLVLFGESANGLIGAEGSIDGKSTNGVASATGDWSSRAKVDAELGEVHGMLRSALHVESFPRHKIC